MYFAKVESRFGSECLIVPTIPFFSGQHRTQKSKWGSSTSGETGGSSEGRASTCPNGERETGNGKRGVAQNSLPLGNGLIILLHQFLKIGGSFIIFHGEVAVILRQLIQIPGQPEFNPAHGLDRSL